MANKLTLKKVVKNNVVSCTENNSKVNIVRELKNTFAEMAKTHTQKYLEQFPMFDTILSYRISDKEENKLADIDVIVNMNPVKARHPQDITIKKVLFNSSARDDTAMFYTIPEYLEFLEKNRRL